MSFFVVHRERGGPWDWSKDMREQVLWDEHAEFMDALTAERFVVLGGPLDERRVMHVVSAESEDAIRTRLAADPWEGNGLLTTTSIEPWNVLLQAPQQRIFPMVAYEDAAAAIDWLSKAFGFREREGTRQTAADGRVGHAELERDGQVVMLASPSADYRGPRRHAEECEQARHWLDNPWVVDGLFVRVEDVVSHHAQALAAGARVIREPELVEAAGMRLYTAEDIEGHRWMFGQAT